MRENMDKLYILEEIRRTAKDNGGKPLGFNKFSTLTGIRESDWFGKYWTKWGDALIEAGYQPNKMMTAYNDEFIIKKLISLIRELRKFPVKGELKLKRSQDSDFPSIGVFRRVGKKAEIARKIIDYCSAREGFEDVIEICKPISKSLSRVQEPTESTRFDDEEFGEVYLMKSGKYHKIGRSNAAGRREYEISLQLPEKPTLIHIIKTDDPVGIEAYWHKRFGNRRKRGEWFELSPEDVKVFKRRTFM